MISTYITYSVAEFQPSDRSVEVTYFDENNSQYRRYVNIPRLEDGSVDEVYLQEILDGQLMGVQNKLKVGVIEFKESLAGIST